MLTLVGIGTWDEKDVSLKGLESIKRASKIYAEFYTSKLLGTSIEKLERLYGKKVHVLQRSDLEENPEHLLEEARENDVVLICCGDPMIATTHVDLRLRAAEMGVTVKIVHGISIYTAAISLSGLQIYKFGRSATVAPPYGKTIPETPYDVVMENRMRGLHTFLYLDIDMSIGDAIEILLEIERRRKDGVIRGIAIGMSKVGSEEPVVHADLIERLRDIDFGDTPHTLIIPGKLHFMEREALIKLLGAPIEALSQQDP